MKFDLMVLAVLAMIGVFFVNSVDKSMKDVTNIVRESVGVAESNDKRLERVEEIVSDIPEMKRELAEIKKLLKAKAASKKSLRDW